MPAQLPHGFWSSRRQELTRMAQDLSASTFLPLHLFATAGVLYLLINTVIALGARSLESRMNWGKRA